MEEKTEIDGGMWLAQSHMHSEFHTMFLWATSSYLKEGVYPLCHVKGACFRWISVFFHLIESWNPQVTGLLLSGELQPRDNQLMWLATTTLVSKFIVVKKKVRAILSSDWRAISLPSHESSGGRTLEAKPGQCWWCNVFGAEADFVIAMPVRWCLGLCSPDIFPLWGQLFWHRRGGTGGSFSFARLDSCGMEDTSKSKSWIRQTLFESRLCFSLSG